MKILILQPNLMVGGIEKSLINLINELKYNHQIDLFLLDKSGDFLNQVDTGKVNILSYNKCSNRGNKKIEKVKKYISIFLSSKKFLNKSLFLKNTHYDLAIVYHGMNLELLKIMKHNVNADRKISFIHGDPRFLNKTILKYSLKTNNKIVCVSNSCKNELIRICPGFENKIDYLYNLRDYDDVIKKSQEYRIVFPKDKINIISVARISVEKGHLRLLKVIKKLRKETSIPFKFHFVGDGAELERIKCYVQKHSLQDVVEFYGNKPNPYPFFKAADLFILMSYNEAAPMVIGECACFKLPILSTETISAVELIGKGGVICKNDSKSLLNSLIEILKEIKANSTGFMFNDVCNNKVLKVRIDEVLGLK